MSAILAIFKLMPSWLYWVFGLIALCGVFELHGRHAEAKKWEAKEAYENSVRIEATLTQERELRRAFDSITVASKKVEQDAKITINRLQSRAHSGALRLSVVASRCETRNTPAGNSETRAYLLPGVAANLIGFAGRCDDTVRELTECVDKYNALRVGSQFEINTIE